jgi:hypothetical protein
MRPLRGVKIVSWRHLGVRGRGNTARVLWMCARATVLSSRGGPWAQVLLDGLEGLTVTVDGVGKRAGQSIEGVLLPDKDRLRVKASQHGRALTLVAFVGEAGHRVASEQEAKELVFVPAEKKETLAEHETTMSGYGRLKMVQGEGDWVRRCECQVHHLVPRWGTGVLAACIVRARRFLPRHRQGLRDAICWPRRWRWNASRWDPCCLAAQARQERRQRQQGRR